MTMYLKRTFAILLSIIVMTAMMSISVEPSHAASKPKLAKKSATLFLGGTAKIKVKNAPKKAKITYKSSNKKIATVTKKGKVTAKKAGKAKITVTVKKGKKKTKLTFTVKARKAKIAVLDEGASKSVSVTKSISVTGTSGYGKKNGHADRQIKKMKEEAPKAAIYSIRVTDDDDVIYSSYMAKGVDRAIEEKVHFIYYSCYGPSASEEEKAAVDRAVKAGIKIIGPAGNNNGADAREMNWMTGHKGCTIVGAYGKNAILKTSNIHADVYIKASSTSAAAARYVGMLAKGKIYDDYYE